MRQEHRPRTSTEIVTGETLQMPPSKLAHPENMININQRADGDGRVAGYVPMFLHTRYTAHYAHNYNASATHTHTTGPVRCC
jgi:hypothetical protein